MAPDSIFFNWVDAHLNDDPAALRLKYLRSTDDGIDYAAAITQVECRRRFGKKLAQTLTAAPRFFFPSVLAGEQATSDLLASYHASFIAEALPAVDLTAGLGIDAFHAAARASKVVALEIDPDRADAIPYNATQLHLDNVELVADDCQNYIDRCIANNQHFATAFIDPARRAGDGSRIFALSDCHPNVLALMPKLARICQILVIKASPMLDVAHTIEVLPVKPLSVIAVGTPTECKELLIIIDFDAAANSENTSAEPLIEAVTLTGEAAMASTFTFTRQQERDCPAPEPMGTLAPGNYIYEASPALTKTGAYKLPAQLYSLKAFHANTRLYASGVPVENFPGQRYRVVEVLPYASRVLKRFARQYPQISITAKNFGITADALRKKLAVRDGGTLRLFAVTDARNEKILIVAEPA